MPVAAYGAWKRRQGGGPTLIANLPALASWTNTGTVRTTGIADPLGGTAAETIQDDSAAAIEFVQVTGSASLASGQQYLVTHYIKKDADTSRFPEIQHLRGTDFAHIEINTSTGAIAVRSTGGLTSVSVSCVTAPEDSGWWKATLAFTANSAGALQYKLLPGAASTFGTPAIGAMGAVTYYPGGLYTP